MIAMLAAAPVKVSAQDEQEVSFQVFYDELSPYGKWIEDDQYGYAWIPDTEDEFSPYRSNGYWVMTSFGNTWVSYYPWGWAPFHYGRWTYDSYYGWIWIPGYEWGPAWVCWRYGGGYYGWAPLGPWFIVSVNFGMYDCPYNWWVFVPHHQLYHRRPNHHHRPRTIINNTTIIVNTQVHQHTTHVTGPRAAEVRAVTGKDVPIYNIEDAKRPGVMNVNNNTVQVYRPGISKPGNGSIRATPKQIIGADRKIGDPKPVRPKNAIEAPVRTMPRPVQQTRPATVPANRDNRRPVKQPTVSPQQPQIQNRERKPVVQPQRPSAPRPTPVRDNKPVQRQEPKRITQPQQAPIRR